MNRSNTKQGFPAFNILGDIMDTCNEELKYIGKCGSLRFFLVRRLDAPDGRSRFSYLQHLFAEIFWSATSHVVILLSAFYSLLVTQQWIGWDTPWSKSSFEPGTLGLPNHQSEAPLILFQIRIKVKLCPILPVYNHICLLLPSISVLF